MAIHCRCVEGSHPKVRWSRSIRVSEKELSHRGPKETEGTKETEETSPAASSSSRRRKQDKTGMATSNFGRVPTLGNFGRVPYVPLDKFGTNKNIQGV